MMSYVLQKENLEKSHGGKGGVIMNNVFGITNLQIKTFDAFQDELTEINKFLTKHNGDIVDIQTVAMLYGKTRYIIIYKEKTLK